MYSNVRKRIDPSRPRLHHSYIPEPQKKSRMNTKSEDGNITKNNTTPYKLSSEVMTKPSKSESTISTVHHNTRPRRVTLDSPKHSMVSSRSSSRLPSIKSVNNIYTKKIVDSGYINNRSQKDITDPKIEAIKEGSQGDTTLAEQGDQDYSTMYDHVTTRLRTTFLDIIEASADKGANDDDVVSLLRGQFDLQTVRIRRLERALREKEDQLIKQKERHQHDLNSYRLEDNENAIPFLLKTYPVAMETYRQQIEEEDMNDQLESCINQFEEQKELMIEQYQQHFEALKLKYRSRFDDVVERMISDPSRLDDEWARRVQRKANDRIKEMERYYMSK